MSNVKTAVANNELMCPKVERVFDNNGLLFKDIILSIIESEVDFCIKESYHHNKINAATSSKEEVA